MRRTNAEHTIGHWTVWLSLDFPGKFGPGQGAAAIEDVVDGRKAISRVLAEVTMRHRASLTYVQGKEGGGYGRARRPATIEGGALRQPPAAGAGFRWK